MKISFSHSFDIFARWKYLSYSSITQYFHITARYCPYPPTRPEDVSVKILHSGLRFGTVCPGSDEFVPLPVTGCDGNAIRLGPVSRTDSTSTYKWMLEKDQGGTLVILAVFTQPLNITNLEFSEPVRMKNLENSTDILLEIDIPITGMAICYYLKTIKFLGILAH